MKNRQKADPLGPAYKLFFTGKFLPQSIHRNRGRQPPKLDENKQSGQHHHNS